jgi:hypothetical protein
LDYPNVLEHLVYHALAVYKNPNKTGPLFVRNLIIQKNGQGKFGKYQRNVIGPAKIWKAFSSRK